MSECKAYVTKAPEGGIEYRSVNITGEEGNVSLKPVLTGICGTDRGIVRGALPFSYDPSNYDYLVIGHESMCEVVESSSSEFSPGDLVIPIVRRPGHCPNCLIGRPDNCSDGDKHEAGITGLHGFMREQFQEFDFNLVKIQDRSIGDLGVLTEPMKNVVKAFEVFERVSSRSIFGNGISTLEGKTALVVGTGCEAFLYSFLAKDYGFDTTISNRHPIEKNSLEMCSEFGIKFVDTSKDPDFPAKPLDLVIDTSGDPGTILKYLRKLNYNGILILFGTNGRAPDVELTGNDIDHIVEKNITIAGSVDAARIHYIKALDYLSKWNRMHGDTMKNIITSYFKPGETSVFTQKPAGEIKSVIKWQ